MKYTILALFLLGSVRAFSQAAPQDTLAIPRDATGKKIAYVEVVPVAGATQDELYARGKVWFAQTYKSAQDVIQADDKASGVLVGKAWQQTTFSPLGFGTKVPYKLSYTVQLSFKEGRYRYEFSDLSFASFPSATDLNPTTDPAEKFTFIRKGNGKLTAYSMAYRQAIATAVLQTTDALKAAMAKPTAGGDW